MLEASNLGQIIGRLMAELAAEAGAEATPTPRRKREPKPGGRDQQVLELAAKLGEIRCADLVAALGIKAGHAYVILSRLRREEKLVNGVRAASYRLP